MARRKDWLPQNHEALYSMATQTYNWLQVIENRTEVGFTPGAAATLWLTNVFGRFYTELADAYAAWTDESVRTRLKQLSLLNAECAFRASFRELYIGFLKGSPLVTNAHLAAMGLPERSKGRNTRAHLPASLPEAETKAPTPAVVEVHFHDARGTSRAKPAGVHGVEILWEISDTPLTAWSELTHSAFDTRTPHTFTFASDERGRRLYFALRWENTRGEKGHLSEIQSVIVP
ncbi:MAG: hypothetical protein LBT48_07105 [Prevotellaceae bacterium]|nr:hypothetical protein [Prevotellaceae bacterium]